MKTGDKKQITPPLSRTTTTPGGKPASGASSSSTSSAVTPSATDAASAARSSNAAGPAAGGVGGIGSQFGTASTPAHQLGLDHVDALWAAGDFSAVVAKLEEKLTPLVGRLGTLDGASTGRWISELHVLQHRGISLANKISFKEDPKGATRALGLLQTIANLQTEVFERAVSLADAKTPEKAVPAWIVHKDTMKKAGFHSPSARQEYFVEKARSFIEKGGNLNDIVSVTPEALSTYKSGEFLEWVVDATDVARLTSADTAVSPGHTLLAWGGDALSAGTLRVFKDDQGKITQAVIGTFSGHFRSGQDTLHHMARHLVAAGVPPEAIVLQGGEAGSARALEVLRRAMGSDGASAQREQAQLDAQAQRHNPFAPTAEVAGKGPSKDEKALYSAMFNLRLAFESAFESGVLAKGTDGRHNKVDTLVHAIDHALTAAEIAKSPVAFFQVRSILSDLLNDSTVNAAGATLQLSHLNNKWKGHAFGSGAVLAGDLLGSRPVADRSTRLMVEIEATTTPEQVRSMLSAGANVAFVDATLPNAESQVQMIRAEAGKLGTSVSIQLDLKDAKTPEVLALARDFADSVVATVESGSALREFETELQRVGASVPVIARVASGAAVDKILSIVLNADGLLVDRGGLAKSIGAANVPFAEKTIHAVGNRFGKPSIVATDIFPSMASSSRGTRAEVEGAYRAVADLGADALLIDAKTLRSDDPGTVIAFAGRIVERAERDLADRPYLELKARGRGPTDGTGVTGEEAAPSTTAPTTTAPTTTAPTTTAPSATGEVDLVRSKERQQIFERLLGPKLDALQTAGKDLEMVDVVKDAISRLTPAAINKMQGEELAATVGELHLLQHRTIGLTNRISAFTDKRAALSALSLLQPIADLQTVAFNRSVAIDKKRNPNEPTAWIAHVDTMKKPGFSAPLTRLAYFALKADKFIQKGGNLNDIKAVNPKEIAAAKSGVLQEFVVDAFDHARFYDATKDVTPGHTLTAFGQDALSAGTLRFYKNDDGEVTQAVIGTFSGHFRAGQESLHHMARHLIAAGIPPERIVLQGGEAGGARALEVLHMATGKDGADAQRELADTNARAAHFNPAAAVVEAEKGPKSETPTFVVKGVLAPADGQALADAVAVLNHESIRLTEQKPISDVSAFIAALKDVFERSETLGNPMAYSNAIGLLAHWTASKPNEMTRDAYTALSTLRAETKAKTFGASALDPAHMIGPRPTEDRRARIVATMNPEGTEASYSKMIAAGMNVARYNPAHASPEELRASMNRVRSAAAKLGKEVAIQVDLTGPKIRLGKFANPDNKKFNDIFLKAGTTVTLTSGDVMGDPNTFPIDIDTIEDIKAGHRVFMNDGTVELKVREVATGKDGKPRLTADVVLGGKVWDKKGVNLPDSALTQPTITDDDKKTLDAVLDLVDVVAVSFVRHPEDILQAREEMRNRGKIVPILAKIERPEALHVLEQIAAVSDGLMVARGDLGVEIGPENVPAAERRIAKLGNEMGRPVMVATEVFQSMSKETEQTKAETEGLFSAIAGLGVDAVMLGKETSFPDHPETTIRAAHQVIEAAEAVLLGKQKTPDRTKSDAWDVRLGIAFPKSNLPEGEGST